MEMLWMEITQMIIKIIVTVLVVVIGVYLVPIIKEKIGAEKYNKIIGYVKYGVNAAEQMFKDTGLGEKKKEFVLNFVNEMLGKVNYSLTEEELNVLIESAVKDMNDAKEMIKTIE